MSCDNVESYTVVTASGDIVRASATEHPDLYWGLRGGGGNFGVVTEFVFRLHPILGTALMVDLTFDVADGIGPVQRWRDLLPDAPRAATLARVSGARRMAGRSSASATRGWGPRRGRCLPAGVPEHRHAPGGGGADAAIRGAPDVFDDSQAHGTRRYSKGHYLPELTDAAIEAYLARGVGTDAADADWTHVPDGGLELHGGAVADIADEDSAYSGRGALLEWSGATKWTDPAEDEARLAAARAYGAAMESFASGVYVNMLGDEGEAGVRRAYRSDKLERLAALKRTWDPDNVFHLNQNIRPG